MSSIFGTSVDDTSIGLNSTFLVGVTSTTEAIQILDQQLTIFNESNLPNGETAPLNNVINNLNTAITDVGDGLSNNLTATNVKTLYESNPDTNCFTNAYKTIVDNVGNYIDASELASALTPYRIATDQDTIDSGKYSTSNPADYQSGMQVLNSISDALIPYRIATDQDTIDSTKLNITDLKSDIVIHPVSGYNMPATYEGTVCCGAIENGMHTIPSGNIPQFSGLDIYDFSSNGVVNFKGSNYYSFNFGTSSCAYVKETAGVYALIPPSVIFGANPGNFVYKFVTNGTILVAISKQSSTKFFWTTDGLTWNAYDIGFNEPLRSLDIIDNVVYVGANFIYKITDVNNPSFISKTVGTNVSKFFKYSGDVYYMSQTGIYDYNSQTLIIGSPGGATQGDVTMSNVIVDGSNLYVITALDNDVWKFDGVSWSVIATTNFNQTYAIHKYGSTIYLGGYTTDESRYGTLIADTFTSVPTNDDSNRQDTGNWYIYGFGDVYSGGGGAAGISVLLDAGANVSANVFDTLTDLATANNEIRTTIGSLALSADVTSEIAASQSAQDSAIAGIYQTQAGMSSYLTTASASSTYQPISGMTSYLTTSDASSTYKTIGSFNSDIANYSTTSQMNTAISQANNTQDASIAATYQTIGAMGAYYTASQVNSAISSSQSTQDSSIASTYATLTQFGYLLRPKIKIVVSSGGSTTPATGQPYSTISSALAATSSGDIVYVCPGTYNENSLTLPAGVELRGMSRFSCFISSTVTSNTTCLTIGGADCKLNDITLSLTSVTNGVNLTVLNISNTYNTTFFMRNCNLNIDSVQGNSICIDSTATGSHVNDAIFNYIDCVFKCNSDGTGIKRCIRSTGAGSDLHFDTCQFSCIRTSTGTDYIAFEVNNATADSQLTNCYLTGTNNDISATNGIIQLGKSTILANSTTNGKAILVFGGDYSYVLNNEGTIGAGTNYGSFGGNFTGNERRLYLSRKCVIYGLTYSNRLNTSSDTTVITVRKNGVDTALIVNMTAASLYGVNTTDGVTFNAGDYVSVKIVRGTGTITDTNISFSSY